MTVLDFDLIIIGSGSGNSIIGPEWDDKRVAVVEAGTFGGTCLNVGCIPTKMFVYAAEVAETVTGSSRYGVDAEVTGVRWPAIRDRIFGRIDPISDAGREYRTDGSNTTLLTGWARFTGPRLIEVSGPQGERTAITAPQVVIATGSRPVLPPVLDECSVPVHTSDTVMRLPSLPGSMLIVGGGYIAAEFAHVFSALGVSVTVVNRSTAMLRYLDADVSHAFTEAACRQWDVRLETEIVQVQPVGGGARVELTDGTEVQTDVILAATGRTPNGDDLGLDAAQVEVHDDGRVGVDDYGRTSAPGVWALGDVSSPWQLKHVANHEARVIAHNLTHPDDLRTFRHDYVPSAVFTHPQVATVGMTEQKARESGYRISVKTQAYSGTAYGWAMEDQDSFLKVIGDRSTGLVLGAHFLGPQSSSLIQPLIQAMAFSMPAHQVARDQYWIHPALAEVVENALLGLEVD
ncbi:MAG: mycothione reductase [Ornithinimicrobium sp.]